MKGKHAHHPVFVPHAGSPTVVGEEDFSFGHRGLGVDQDAAEDKVNHPSHYTAGSIECIEAIRAATAHLSGFEGYCTGAIVKYVWRWKLKGGVEDLKKANWYLTKLIEETDE